jgi:hypothetical protein
MPQRLLLLALLFITGLASAPSFAQRAGNWERVDTVGTHRLTVNINRYYKLLVQGDRVTLSGSSPLQGYWAQYTGQGALTWRRLLPNRAYIPGIACSWGQGSFSISLGRYYWVTAQGDTFRVVRPPASQYDILPQEAVARNRAYYVGGRALDSSTIGGARQPCASLLRIDSAGTVRWQRRYPNPVVRNSPTQPAYKVQFTPLKLLPGPRQGLVLLGSVQGDSSSQHLYFLETDSAGRQRRVRAVRPFGWAQNVSMTGHADALALRDGSGYVVTGDHYILGTGIGESFVCRIDTALRVVWTSILPVLGPGGQPDPTAQGQPGLVRELPDGSLAALVQVTKRGQLSYRNDEFDLARYSPQGQLLDVATYCSQYHELFVSDYQWRASDSSLFVSGGVAQHSATGQVLTRPAWLAHFATPCRRSGPLATTPSSTSPTLGLTLYPQPAAPGAVLTLALARPGRGPVQVTLLDALGRVVAAPVATGNGSEALRLALPPGLAPGFYAVRVRAAGQPVATARLLVQAP